ncbi:retrovirus-related pol polyprotein from transposon TNT 1-94 [Tanacetum coccineum]
MILEFVESGPLTWPSIMENGVTRPKKYSELSATEALQADCDIKATNIILQGLPPEVYALVSNHKVAKELWERIQLLMQGTSLTKQEMECKLYDEFDKFAYKKGESLREFYLRFSLLLNDMNIYNMKLEQFQVNTKFLNTLPPEWSKFVTDVKLVRDLHTTNIDQLHAYLGQHEFHANESPQYGSPYKSQQYSTHQSLTPLSITYPSNDYQSSIHHNIYSLSSSIPQLEYPPSVDQQSEFSQQESGLIAQVFQKGNDLINAINHMMLFFTAVVTSCYPTTNNHLRNSSNPRQQATINNGRVTLQPIRWRQTSVAAGASRTYTPGASGNNFGKQRMVICYNCKGEGHMSKQCNKPKKKQDDSWFKDKVLLVQAQASGQILHEEELAFLADPKECQKEEAAVLRDLVDHIQANYPLDPTLESTCKYAKLIQELLSKISKTYPSLNNSGEQLVAVTLMNKVKKFRFTEPVLSSRNTIPKRTSTSNLASNKPMLSSTGVKPSTSASGSQPSGNIKKDKILQTQSSTQKNKVEAHPRKVKSSLKNKDHVVAPKGTAHVQHSKLNANSELKCVKCNGCMLSDNHDLCVLDYINNVNARAKSKSAKKQTKRKVWKPTGKMFTTIGYIWRPTGRTFTIVGNACPLTRITTTTEAPLRKPVVLDNETSKPAVTLVYSRKPRNSKTNVPVSKSKVVQIVLWYLDSGCSKHMTGDRSQLTNFVNKFLGTVKFGNDHVAKILGYGDYQIGNVTISRVYYVEGLGHNLFSVGQFCDSNLEVAFRQHTCFIRNLEGVDLLTGSRGNNLYTLSLGDMMASSPICLLSKASKTKSWLWHRRLSHLNFGAINHLARHGLVRGLPKLKFEKDHLCSACAMGKSKKKPHKPKSEDTNQEKLYLLHMDLCGPMRVSSVNEKKYILIIVDDYSQFTWVKFLRSKNEAPNFIIKFLKMIQLWLKVPVRRIRTDNGTEFVNQTLREYYEKVGISHETSVARSPQQNGVIERWNRTLIEVAHTMLIYAKAPLFLWAEAVATACYTKNRSIIQLRHDKTPYELLHDKLPDLSFFHVFGALYYPTNDNFDELTAMASEHSSSGLALHEMTPATISSRLVPNPPPLTPFVPPLRTDWDMLFQSLFDELLNPLPSVDHPALKVVAPIDEVATPVPTVSTSSPSSTTIDQDAPSPSNSQTTPDTQPPVIPNDVKEDNHDIEVAHMGNDLYFGIPILEVPFDQSSSSDSIHTNMPPDYQISKHNNK